MVVKLPVKYFRPIIALVCPGLQRTGQFYFPGGYRLSCSQKIFDEFIKSLLFLKGRIE